MVDFKEVFGKGYKHFSGVRELYDMDRNWLIREKENKYLCLLNVKENNPVALAWAAMYEKLDYALWLNEYGFEKGDDGYAEIGRAHV